mmetsp:Transcript_23916/g.36594  ORF Transcript_23916/g.36594 Transcript_23916/m.36594 type:complete len:122 (+) Transcript_23916:162-527(+)
METEGENSELNQGKIVAIFGGVTLVMLAMYTVVALRNYFKDQEEEEQQANKEKSLSESYKDFVAEKVKRIHERDNDIKYEIKSTLSKQSKGSKKSKASQRTKGSKSTLSTDISSTGPKLEP